jgi:hypothetical protein
MACIIVTHSVCCIEALLLYYEKGEKNTNVGKGDMDRHQVKRDEANKAAASLKKTSNVQAYLEKKARLAEDHRRREGQKKAEVSEREKKRLEASKNSAQEDLSNGKGADSDRAAVVDSKDDSVSQKRAATGEAGNGEEAPSAKKPRVETTVSVQVPEGENPINVGVSVEVVQANSPKPRGRPKKSVDGVDEGSKSAKASRKKLPGYKFDDPNDYIQLRIAKYFDKDLYYGTITEFSPSTENEEKIDLWRGKYDDGDEEDYEEKELMRLLKLYVTNYEDDDHPSKKSTEFATERRGTK